MANFVKVARVEQVAPGAGIAVEAAGKIIAIFNLEGTFYALDNTCPHRGGPLGEGFVEGKSITCPWHGWEFDIASGCYAGDPSKGVAIYPVRVEGEDILVEV